MRAIGGRWSRGLLLLALLWAVGTAPGPAGAAEDDALRAVLAGLPAKDAPLRVRFDVSLPPFPKIEGLDPIPALDRLDALEEVVLAMLSRAGFERARLDPASQDPLLVVTLKGTHRKGSAKPSTGTAVGAGPGVLVEGTVTLTTKGGSWSQPLAAGATLGKADAAVHPLALDALFGRAASQSGVVAALDALVRARDGRRTDALLAALDRGWTDGWFAGVLQVLRTMDAGEVARSTAERLHSDHEGLGDAAVLVLPELGAAGAEALAAAPSDGPIAYRWRRLKSAREMVLAGTSTPALLDVLHAALSDPATVLRTMAVRAVAAVDAEAAVDALVAALDDRHASVREHARDELARLSGAKFLAEPEPWKTWRAERAAKAKAAQDESVAAGKANVPLSPFGLRPRRGAPAPRSKDPVPAALARLAALQKEDGRWPAAAEGFSWGEPALTGLALLAFLHAGHAPVEGDPYGAALVSGLGYLIKSQDPEGCFGERATQHYVYNTPFPAYALIEAYAATRNPAYRAAAQKGLDFLALARNPYFVWRYGVKPGDNDTFTSLCAILPHVAARQVNEVSTWAREAPPFTVDEDAFGGVRAWLEKMTDTEHGWVGYVARGRHDGARYQGEAEWDGEQASGYLTLTSGAAFVRSRGLGEAAAKSDVVLKAVGLAARAAPAWPPDRTREVDLFGWWFGSLLAAELPAADGRTKTWNKAVSLSLPAALADPDLAQHVRWSWAGGEVLAQSLAVLAFVAPAAFPALDRTRSDLAKVAGIVAAGAPARTEALRAYARFAPAKAVALAVPWLKDADAVLRTGAQEVLAAYPAEAATSVNAMLQLLTHKSEEVRLGALRALAPHAKGSPPVRAALVQALEGASAPARAVAVDAWPRGEPLAGAALATVEARLAEPDPQAARAALELLRSGAAPLRSAHAEALLKHASPALRREGVLVLAGLAGEDASRGKLLDAAGRDPDASVRAAAARALGGVPGPEALASLQRLAADADHGVGRAVAEAFAQRARTDPALVERFSEGLAATSPPMLRRRCAQALARLGKAAAGAEAAIHAAIKGEVAKGDAWDAPLLLALAEAQWNVTGGTLATAGILQGIISQSEDPDARLGAVDLLGGLPDAGAWASRQLVATMDESGPMLLAVLNAFADQGGRALGELPLVEWVLRVYGDDNPDLLRHAEVAKRRIVGR